MKLTGLLLAGLVSLCPLKTHATQSANATIFCYSPRFQRGLDPGGNYYLNLTSLPGAFNGELGLDFLDSGYTHSAYLSLVDESLGETLAGQLALDVPDGGDGNHDGFPDFFQTSQGITNIVSTGAYHLDLYGNGNTTATWNRNAGSKDGSCALTIKLMPFQPVTFTIPFEILEYKGSLKYASTATNVTGGVDLAQTGNSGVLMTGQLALLKSPSDPFNQLTLLPGS